MKLLARDAGSVYLSSLKLSDLRVLRVGNCPAAELRAPGYVVGLDVGIHDSQRTHNSFLLAGSYALQAALQALKIQAHG